MFTEDDLLPLSGLQHVVYCERRFALVHVEQVWADNAYTVEGSHAHARAHHADEEESRGDVRIVRSLAVRSFRLGVSGKTDVVEFHRLPEDDCGTCGASIEGLPGRWRVFPVEYKRGVARHERCYEVQLCGQAMCLEEVLHVGIDAGCLFYGASHKRVDVPFTEAVRGGTVQAAQRMHELYAAQVTPPATKEPKCEGCSLLPVCMPSVARGRSSAVRYLVRALQEADPRQE